MPDRPSPLQVVSLHDPAGLAARVASKPELVRARFDVIANLRAGGAAGYDVLLALDEDEPRSPAAWAAELHPQAGGPFEARLLEVALAQRERLPSTAMLGIRLSANGLRADAVRKVLEDAGDLRRTVIVTAADDAGGSGAARDTIAALRDAGGSVAVDETGSSYGSLQTLIAVRPDFVRVGPEFVTGIDIDPAKAAVVEAIMGLCSRIDAWVVARGIKGRAELSALRRMRVPLGQGRLFGEPAKTMDGLSQRAQDAIKRAAPPVAPAETVAALVEARPPLPWASSLDEVAEAFLEVPEHDVVVLVDELNRPLALADRAALLSGEPYERPVTRVTPSSPLRAVARRAAARPLFERYHPLVACDRRGVYLGLVRVEQLLDALAQE